MWAVTKPDGAEHDAHQPTQAAVPATGFELAAFKAFQSGIRERCIEPPQPGGATIVGNYRMLAEP